jgi:hypothetical protein
LAELLGLPPVQVNRVNSSARDETLSPHIREAFTAENRLEFEIYHYKKFLGVQGPFFKKVPGCQGQK